MELTLHDFGSRGFMTNFSLSSGDFQRQGLSPSFRLLLLKISLLCVIVEPLSQGPVEET